MRRSLPFISIQWAGAMGIFMLGLVGCSDGGGKSETDTMASSDSQDSGHDTASAGPATAGDDTTPVDTDTATEAPDTQSNASDSAGGELLRLSDLPNFHVPLPSSLSHSMARKKALVAEDLDEVQSEGYYQLQEARIFDDQIYGMRGLITFLETYTQNNNVPENEVVTLGVQTGILYEGGPSDGQPINPHLDMVDTENSYEGIDLGKLKWWKEGETIQIVWHITDTAFEQFPLWAIEITSGDTDTDAKSYRIAAYREQWDGTQTSKILRYLSYDAGSGETVVYQRDVGYNNDLAAGEINYRFVNLMPHIDVPLSEPEMVSGEVTDTETEAMDTDTSSIEETDLFDTLSTDTISLEIVSTEIVSTDSVSTDTVSTDAVSTDTTSDVGGGDTASPDSETDSDMGTDTATEASDGTDISVMADASVVYLENGSWNPIDMSQYVSSQIAAVGNSEGGGVLAFTVPALLYEDDGTEVIYHYYYRELYNGFGNLVARSYSKKFDDYCELTDFSGFMPDTEAFNHFESSPVMAPQVIYRRYEFDFASNESTYGISVDDPAPTTWMPLSVEDAILRPIWKQNIEAGSNWQPGDVVYQQDLTGDMDCSVSGQTACTISVFRQYATYPDATMVFGREFYAENQWSIRYLRSDDALTTIKVDILDDWPYLQTWLESDDNDIYDADETPLPASIFDVYYYTGDGYLVSAAMPMIYRAADTPPPSLLFDEDAQQTSEKSVQALHKVVSEMVPALSVPHALDLLSEEAFLALFEPDATDTDVISIGDDASSTDTVSP